MQRGYCANSESTLMQMLVVNKVLALGLLPVIAHAGFIDGGHGA